jgi:nitrogenase molybdenum-iron protein NifN
MDKINSEDKMSKIDNIKIVNKIEIGADRNYVNMQVNPCKMCMPMGASQALKGFKKTMNIIHGSQGCSTYIRRHMAAHYNEPVDIASSSLSEEGTVYGGSKNLKLGIKNLVNMYEPEMVGVLTSCLAETIGDDIHRIVKEIRETGEFDNVDIIPISTPGYGGSQSEGYFLAIKSIIEYFGHKYNASFDYEEGISPSKTQEKISLEKKASINNKSHINLIVSNATCEDIRELKRLGKLLDVEFLILPDISDVLDAPYKESFDKLSSDGLSREEIYKVFYAKATIELGDLVADHYSPALYLQDVFDIPSYRMPLPIGISHMDRFMETILSIENKTLPEELNLERGRLIDAMIDAHKHSAMGACALFGDMDLVYSISGLLLENGIGLKVAATGSTSKNFKEKLNKLSSQYQVQPLILQDSDFETIREEIMNEKVNLMIGNSDGKFIWEKDGIDFIRVGFPVHDHIGAQRKLRMGYKGSVRLLDEIINHLLDQKHAGYRDRMIAMYYPKKMMNREEALWKM